MDRSSQNNKKLKNLSSLPISPNLQCIDKPLLLPPGTQFQFNNLIVGMKNNIDNNMTILVADKFFVDMELENLSHFADDGFYGFN